MFKGGPMRSGVKVDSALHRGWMLVALRGVLAIVASAILLTRPSMGRGLLLATLGSYLFIDGALAVLHRICRDEHRPGRPQVDRGAGVKPATSSRAGVKPATSSRAGVKPATSGRAA